MDYIVHYGIKGQVHGKRRFQREDGSLTEAGKLRYGRGKKKYDDYYEDDGMLSGFGKARYNTELYKAAQAEKKQKQVREEAASDAKRMQRKVDRAKNGLMSGNGNVGKKTMAGAKVLAAKGESILNSVKNSLNVKMQDRRTTAAFNNAINLGEKLYVNSPNKKKTYRDIGDSNQLYLGTREGINTWYW